MKDVATALERVKKTAIIVIAQEEQTKLELWSQMQAEIIKHNEALLPGLWGVEQDAKLALQSDLEKAKSRKLWLDSRIRYSRNYHGLSFDPLGWRNNSGWPKLVVFTTESPTMTFTASSRGSNIDPSLPVALSRPYQDVLNKLTEEANQQNKQLSLIFKMSGLIPKEAKAKADLARDRGLKVFIIAEPTKVQLEVRPVPVPLHVDPLIVGLDTSGQLWLIADFDTTPTEEAMFFYQGS
jgi:hypothetical protein